MFTVRTTANGILAFPPFRSKNRFGCTPGYFAMFVCNINLVMKTVSKTSSGMLAQSAQRSVTGLYGATFNLTLFVYDINLTVTTVSSTAQRVFSSKNSWRPKRGLNKTSLYLTALSNNAYLVSHAVDTAP